MTDSALRARAAALGDKIRAEDGVARAIEIIERDGAEFKAARAGERVAALAGLAEPGSGGVSTCNLSLILAESSWSKR